jgi:hypothetical protein
MNKEITSCSKCHIKKLTDFQPVEKFLVIYGIRKLITTFSTPPSSTCRTQLIHTGPLLEIDGKIILKWNFKKWDGAWTGVM